MSRNEFAGTCYRCGKRCEPFTGHFERITRVQQMKWGGKVSGKWFTQHADCAIKWRGTNRHFEFAPDVQPLAEEPSMTPTERLQPDQLRDSEALAKRDGLVPWLRKAASAIFLACDEIVACDISPKFTEAADCIEALERELALTTAPRDAGERHRKAAEEIVDYVLRNHPDRHAPVLIPEVAAIIARLIQKEPT